jgi:hypothetical protein
MRDGKVPYSLRERTVIRELTIFEPPSITLDSQRTSFPSGSAVAWNKKTNRRDFEEKK